MALNHQSLFFEGTSLGATANPKDIWQEFTGNPYKHPQIPNVAFAGYDRGADLPRPAVVVDATAYGARNDGSADASGAINTAIAEAGERGGGAVLLPAGRYRVDDVVLVGHSDVVLRGEGSGRTTLFVTRPLEEMIGAYGSGKSAWSWCGGAVWVSHRDRYRSFTGAVRGGEDPHGGWTGNARDLATTLTGISSPAARGDFELSVADSRGLTPGRRVLLQLDDDREHSLLKHLCGDIPGASTYDWSKQPRMLRQAPFTWPVSIASVTGTEVTLAQPLPLDVRLGWRPRLTTMGPAVTGAGVEGLTIEMRKVRQARHLQDRGYNGLTFQCAWDCWADDVRVVHSDNGILLYAAKGVTLRRTTIAGRGRHHSYTCNLQSHDNLIQDFTIERFTERVPGGAVHHGLDVETLSCGNVWSRGEMHQGTFDTHRGLPFHNVRTEITVNNDGRPAGGEDAGPLHGARFTHWNINVTNRRAGCIKIDDVAPYSATVGVSQMSRSGPAGRPVFGGPLHARLAYDGDTSLRPSNLYEAQRALRGGGPD
ncbi:glycoside hydrolase family 55 protein [Streptomyces cucumeris]|uniref:glycoside hydrolase family 55 protein n=1 Tax=Streptomyces cucumeris TaxID=2962890 RepID=UPI0020C8FE32|nr:glycoside hydrolase family 55 protein [Streptomyces sp. NEAU-Y11]MCP9208440.1 glycoside hydrolase family 55 protein [Streptomyces sp. NEAU-Y11]